MVLNFFKMVLEKFEFYWFMLNDKIKEIILKFKG